MRRRETLSSFLPRRQVTSRGLFSNKSVSTYRTRRSSGLSRLYDARAKDDNNCWISFPLATIQIVIARNRNDRHLGLRSALSARGKHLLLKCTLRSAGASIFQRAPKLFVFTASPSNYRRWAHVANGRRAINRSIISSRTASLLDNGRNGTPFVTDHSRRWNG